MEIHLHADPSCPFTWVVASWLRQATAATGDELVVRPLSLGVVNEGNDDVPEVYARAHRSARRALRVMEAVRTSAGDDVATRLFFELAGRFHRDGDDTFAGIADALAAVGAPAEALAAADDPAADAPLVEGVELAGRLIDDSPGSPIVSFPEQGRAFWGPILQSVPDRDTSVELLGAVATLARIPAFGQVKGPIGDLEVA
ncbi:MAG: hypothetical protein S0880_30870 [Actinomycetota bacterium]|nr:hypothetical protein [Actinomycetota bacterium]